MFIRTIQHFSFKLYYPPKVKTNTVKRCTEILNFYFFITTPGPTQGLKIRGEGGTGSTVVGIICLVEIGLTDLSNIWGAEAPQSPPPLATALYPELYKQQKNSWSKLQLINTDQLYILWANTS